MTLSFILQVSYKNVIREGFSEMASEDPQRSLTVSLYLAGCGGEGSSHARKGTIRSSAVRLYFLASFPL